VVVLLWGDFRVGEEVLRGSFLLFIPKWMEVLIMVVNLEGFLGLQEGVEGEREVAV
jgi:hypothetical protein